MPIWVHGGANRPPYTPWVTAANALYHGIGGMYALTGLYGGGVFDEATAALDNQTEREVTRAIAALHGTRTLIAIAHRLSTVEGCDRLIFQIDGRVAGIGTYQVLIRMQSFRSMARATHAQ